MHIVAKLEIWRYLELCGYAGMILFAAAAAYIFWKVKIYEAFWYFSKKWKRKREWKKQYRKRMKVLICVCVSGICFTAGCSRTELASVKNRPVKANMFSVSAREMPTAADTVPEIIILPSDKCNLVENINYYNEGIYGKISVEKEWVEKGEIMLRAVPLDNVAEEEAGIDRESSEDGSYKIQDWYVDENRVEFYFNLQGKWMIAFSCRIKTEENSSEQVYTAESEPFVVDREEPELSVIYGNCREISSAKSSEENVNRIIQRNIKRISSSDCEVFASGKGEVTIKIKEDYFSPEDVRIKVFKEDYESGRKQDVAKQWEQRGQSGNNQKLNGGKWEQKGNTFILQYQWEEEGHYQFHIEYEDKAGNRLTAQENSETDFCMDGSAYEGPTYTLDNTPPELKAFIYDQEPGKIWGARSYFTESPVIIVEIEEENFNQQDFSFQNVMTRADRRQIRPLCSEDDYAIVWTSSYEKGKRRNRAVIALKEEANYTFSGWVTDGCGQKSSVQEGQCTYDTTPPEIMIRIKGQDFFAPYETYQYFGRKKMIVSVTAKDDISGVQAIMHKEGREESEGSEAVISSNEKTDVLKDDLSEYSTDIVVSQQDFKGTIFIWAKNFAGQKSREVNSPGMILASPSMHQNSSGITLELSEADYTDEKKKVKYYRGPITITAKGTDSYAGIREFTLDIRDQRRHKQEKAVSEEEQPSRGQESGWLDSDWQNKNQKKDIVYEKMLTMHVKAEDFQDTGEKKPLKIGATLIDNAGNQTSEKYKEYRVVTDSQKPEVGVVYDTDDAENGQYYNCTRTATVTVRDRNFNPHAVRWDISGSNQNYQIGRWTGEGELHQCQVTFAEEGKNYRIKLEVEDYAGNKTVWDEDHNFTIDKTPPVIEMAIDAGNAENKIYYRSPQKITFHVKDKNIDPESAAVYFQNRRKKGKTISLTHTESNHYIATQMYKKDGEYRLYFQCTDLAGNVSKSEQALRFVIDRTAPEIQVDGAADNMAYTGKVCPSVTVRDKNLADGLVNVKLEKIDGAVNRAIDGVADGASASGVSAVIAKYTWVNFPYNEEADGVYRLQAYAEDLAGNHSTLGKGIVFTVNRFGSVYVLQDGLETILKRGYMRKPEGIVITEYSVNPVDTRITILKDNQSWRELYLGDIPSEKESAQEMTQRYHQPAAKSKIESLWQRETRDGKYAVLTGKAVLGERSGWYVKRHFISERNFREEGTYQITLESSGYIMKNGKRNIIKETSSTLRGKTIYFTVDKTPPVVQIGGLEQEYYEEETHPFVITVMDNFAFAHMDLTIRREDADEKEETIRITPDDLESNQSVVKELKAYEGRQTISYQAWDAAGNCLDSEKAGEEISCVVLSREMVEKRKSNVKSELGEAKDWGETENPRRSTAGLISQIAGLLLAVLGLAAAAGAAGYRKLF